MDKQFSYPEGIMTEREWVSKFAVRLEKAAIVWSNLIDRRKWNRMNGDEQKEYESRLQKKAEKPEFRAWKKDNTFQVISKETYLWAQNEGIIK